MPGHTEPGPGHCEVVEGCQIPKYHRHCNGEGCTASVLRHYWAHIKAGDEGWFFQKDGSVWCPNHLPEWLEAWRAQKLSEK